MWSIVHFTKDNSVSAVPSHWWKNGYCAWPKTSAKNAYLLLQRRAIPNKCDYDYFKARIIHTKNPIKSYIDAKERARKAQFTSDLSSAEENYHNSRSNKLKSISPPVFSDNDDDENEIKNIHKSHSNSQLPETIKSNESHEIIFENQSNSRSESITNTKNKPIELRSHVLSGYENDEVMNNSQSKSTHTMYNKRITTIKLADHEVLAENSDETMDNEDNSDIDKTYEPPNNDKNEMNDQFNNIIKSPVGLWKVVSSEVPKSQHLNDDQYIRQAFTHKTPDINKIKKRLFISDGCIETKKFQKSQSKVSSFDNLFQSSAKSNELVQMQHLNNDTEFVSFVKSSLTNLKYDLKLLSYSIDSLKTMIQSIEVNTSNISSINAEHNVMDIQELIWPISNVEELNVIEKFLTDTNIKKNEVGLLARLVGKSISESIRRMMSRMFEDSFLQNYSFLGFKGKSKFYGLNCCQLLFDALRKDKKFSETPDHEISSVAAKWLAQATNRIMKKKKKNQTKN